MSGKKSATRGGFAQRGAGLPKGGCRLQGNRAAGREPGTALAAARILVVDDHGLVRQGLTRLLDQQPDLCVCAAVGDAEQALEYLRHHPVDLAIVDISLGRMDGLQLTGRLRSTWPGLRILIFSMCDPVVSAQRARHAGASGFVAKTEAGDILLTAVHQILAGRTYFGPLPGASR